MMTATAAAVLPLILMNLILASAKPTDILGNMIYYNSMQQRSPRPQMRMDAWSSNGLAQLPNYYYDNTDCCPCPPEIQCFPDYYEYYQEPPASCPGQVPGWIQISGHQIYLGEEDEQLSWFRADALAVERGGYLMQVRSEEDAKIIQQIEPCYPSRTRIWIGGNDLASPGKWVWSTGTLISGYENWLSSSHDSEGHCMEVDLSTRENGWKKSRCAGGGKGTLRAYLVFKTKDQSYKPSVTTTTSSPAVTTAKPDTGTSPTPDSATAPVAE